MTDDLQLPIQDGVGGDSKVLPRSKIAGEGPDGVRQDWMGQVVPTRPSGRVRVQRARCVIKNDCDVDEAFVLSREIKILSTRRRRVAGASPLGREFDPHDIAVEPVKPEVLPVLILIAEIRRDSTYSRATRRQRVGDCLPRVVTEIGPV